MAKKKQKEIRNFSELREEKERLKKQLAKREKKIHKRLGGMQDSVQPDNLISGFADNFGLNPELIGFALPLILKYRKRIFNIKLFKKMKGTQQKAALFSIAGLSIGLFGYLYFQKMKQEKKEKEERLRRQAARANAMKDDQNEVIF